MTRIFPTSPKENADRDMHILNDGAASPRPSQGVGVKEDICFLIVLWILSRVHTNPQIFPFAFISAPRTPMHLRRSLIALCVDRSPSHFE
jgi:hypothetical protein